PSDDRKTHLRQNRSPSRLQGTDRRPKTPHGAAGQRHMPDRALARRPMACAEQLDAATVRAPGRRFVLPRISQVAHVPARRRHHRDTEIADDMSEGDEIAARAPFGRGAAAPEEADAPLVRTIGIHDVALLAARTIAFEHDLPAVWR